MDGTDDKTGTVIAFFDLDHTLLDGANGTIYVMQMVREGLMERKVLLLVTWYSILYKLNRLPREAVYKKVLDEMGRYSVLRMIEMMDTGFERFIVPRLYQGGVDIVDDHRGKGHLTVIATAAGEYIAERVRAQLGADDFIATPTPIKGDYMTSEVMGPMAFMEGKLDMARQYCAERGAELSDCWFYSDSASDLPLLEAVGHPVMVNPQLKLRTATRGRRWPVLRFKEYAVFESIVRPVRVLTPEMNDFLSRYEATLTVEAAESDGVASKGLRRAGG
jgi:HAD superfamily hydrolase (TIGR01490 family)